MVQRSVQRELKLRDAVVVKASFNRPNIKYSVRYKGLIAGGPVGGPSGEDEAVLQDLVQFIKSNEGQCGIVYARLR
jgi:superfamily II DNA helicase RecQ